MIKNKENVIQLNNLRNITCHINGSVVTDGLASEVACYAPVYAFVTLFFTPIHAAKPISTIITNHEKL